MVEAVRLLVAALTVVTDVTGCVDRLARQTRDDWAAAVKRAEIAAEAAGDSRSREL